MFDRQTVLLINSLPHIGDFTGEIAQPRLAQAYLELVRMRVSTEVPGHISPQVIAELRQMVDGLELFCLIEFARENESLESGRAAAFIAAQSLELLIELQPVSSEKVRHILASSHVMLRIEAGLLYLIAGYYANAAVLAEVLSGELAHNVSVDNFVSYEQVREHIANDVLRVLVGLLQLNLRTSEHSSLSWLSPQLESTFSRAPSDLGASIEARLLLQIGQAVRIYLQYLAGINADYTLSAVAQVTQVRRSVSKALSPKSEYQAPAETLLPHHLACLLEVAFNALQDVATVYQVSSPENVDSLYREAFHYWLQAKAGRGYSLLWPSAREWLRKLDTSQAAHTVVSMPTGSGKSFLGELALARNLHRGWGLYLAPMNALVRQIQQDLERELQEIGVGKIHSFLTDEHTTFEEEIFTGASAKEIVVMTPEKALLAIRLNPKAFEQCSVCIFDECHLLDKERRGAISDDFMARLLAQAPNVHVLLMSAMVQNPEDLARWLQDVTAKVAVPVLLSWKPTRSLRTLAVIPQNELERVFERSDKPTSSICLLGYAQTAWLDDKNALYVNTCLPVDIQLKGNLEDVKWANSVNDAARQIAASFAQRQISTLLFLNTNASHVWTHAGKSPNLQWVSPQNPKTQRAGLRVEAWLNLAEQELGCRTFLRDYYDKGVTVHSGALIDEERRAAEIAYRYGLVGLMVATGTLSQGLNFPSQVVVMAGIEGSPHVGERGSEDILNALGRSGRARFHNVGLSVIVPKNVLRSLTVAEMVQNAPSYLDLLRREDACLYTTSALKEQVDKVILASQQLAAEGVVNPEDLTTATLILGNEEQPDAVGIFGHSYAAHRAGVNYASEGVQAANKLIEHYIHQTQCPAWIPQLAQKAGLSVSLMYEMFIAIEQLPISLNSLLIPCADFRQTVDLLQSVLSNVSPLALASKFGTVIAEDGTMHLGVLPKKLRGIDLNWSVAAYEERENWSQQWMKIFELLWHWMKGETYVRIAIESFELQFDGLSSGQLSLLPSLPSSFIASQSRSDRSPLHKAIQSIRDLSYPLRHISGGLVLLAEKLLKDQNLITPDISLPLSVGMLSQAIHWGVDTLEKALWYYSLLPVRCIAHSFAEAFSTTYQDDVQIKREIRVKVSRIKDNPGYISSLSADSTRANAVLQAVKDLLLTAQNISE